MKFNITSYTLFLFVMVFYFSSLILAPWTDDNSPQSAPEGLELTCERWIEFNGFTLTDYDENVRLTGLRNVKLDKDATPYAALYAFYISGHSPPPKILPEQFCDGINANNITYPFSTLKERSSTCPGWIYLYGFIEYDSLYSIGYASIQNTTFNIAYASNKIPEEMNEISIWAYSYYTHVIRWGNEFPIKPSEFCVKMEINIGENTRFINTHGPHLTCKAWIELYGYNDEINNNLRKARRLLSTETFFHIRIHDLPRDYAKRLRLWDRTGDDPLMTPLMYCRTFVNTTNQVDDSETYSFGYTFSSFPENTYRIVR